MVLGLIFKEGNSFAFDRLGDDSRGSFRHGLVLNLFKRANQSREIMAVDREDLPPKG